MTSGGRQTRAEIAVLLPPSEHDRRSVLAVLRWVRGSRLLTLDYRHGHLAVGSFEAHIHHVESREPAGSSARAAQIARRVMEAHGVGQLCIARSHFAPGTAGFLPLDTSGLRVTHWVAGASQAAGAWEPFPGAATVVVPNSHVAEMCARQAPEAVVLEVPPAREPLREGRREQDERRPGPMRALLTGDASGNKRSESHILLENIEAFAEVHAVNTPPKTPKTVPHPHVPPRALPAVLDEIDPDILLDLRRDSSFHDDSVVRAWQLGLPVLTADTGAGKAAVERYGGGEAIDGIVASQELLRRAASHKPSTGLWRAQVTVAEDLRTLAFTPFLRDRPMVGLVSRATAASAIIRTGLVSAGAEREGYLTVRHASARDLIAGSDHTKYDAIVVQRDAVPGHHVGDLIKFAKANAIRLVVELDDDLVSPTAVERLVQEGYSPEALAGLRSLCEHADQLIVSTEPLRDRVQAITRSPIYVFPNRLDPDLWQMPVDTEPAPSGTRLLYFGTPTHGGDLDLIAHLPQSLTEALGREVGIDVVGVTAGPLPSGFDRLTPTATHYQGFVAWLRSNRSRWVAGLAPLVPDDLNQSKSDLKLLEYAALGLPAVASAVGPYAKAAHLAILVSGGAEDWLTALTNLLNDGNGTEQVRAAQAHLVKYRLLDAAAKRQWASNVLGRGRLT